MADGGRERLHAALVLGLAHHVVGRPLDGRSDVVLAHDVVAIEHATCAVPRDGHGDPLGHAGPHHVPHGRTPEIVKETPRHPSRLTGRAPRPAKVAQRLPVAVKDEGAIEPPTGSTASDEREQVGPEDEQLATLRLATLAPQADRPTDDLAPAVLEVNVAPLERPNLAAAPADEVGESHRVGNVGRQLAADRLEVGGLQEALAHVVLGEESDAWPVA
ncbi:MAG TPA: hypothetical protein VKW76_13445 [Candidatus Binatia bacterium]|nr:hypothetical protein [Candidatus Binatia bacterium]